MPPTTTTVETISVSTGSPQKPPVEPRVRARDLVSQFLGNPSGQAQDMVAELSDGEVADVVAAGADRHQARREIKRILAFAHARRSSAAAQEAARESEMLRRRGVVRAVLEREMGMPVDVSAELVPQLDEESVKLLLTLEKSHDVADVCEAVLERAGRLRAAADEPQPASESEAALHDPPPAAEAATDEPPAAATTDGAVDLVNDDVQLAPEPPAAKPKKKAKSA